MRLTVHYCIESQATDVSSQCSKRKTNEYTTILIFIGQHEYYYHVSTHSELSFLSFSVVYQYPYRIRLYLTISILLSIFKIYIHIMGRYQEDKMDLKFSQVYG